MSFNNGNGNGKNGNAAPKNGNGNGRRRMRRQTDTLNQAGRRLVGVAKSELQTAGLELFDFFDTMMNPEDRLPQRIPDNLAGTTAVFKAPTVLELPFGGVWNPSSSANGSTTELADPPVNGYSEVILVPGTSSSTFHTLGVAVELIATGDRDSSMIPVLVTRPSPAQGSRIGHGLRLSSSERRGYACLPKQNTAGDYVYEMNIGPDATQEWVLTVEFRNVGNPTFAGGTRAFFNGMFSNAGGAPVPTGEITATINGSHDIVSFGLDPAAEGSADAPILNFWVSVEDTDPSSQWVMSLTGDANAAPWPMSLAAGSACAFRILDTPFLGALSDTESERTTALTGLCSYMGSHLQDGGVISAARLGMGLSPINAPMGDVYGFLAQLPFYNDDYALKIGAYCWWLPDSIQEYFYTPYRSPRSDFLDTSSLLCFAMHRDDPDQAVRLRVQQCIEVITRSVLYAAEPAPVNPSYDMIVSAIKAVPAVTVNEAHPGLLKRALGRVKGMLSNPSNWMKLLTSGAKFLGMG